MNNSLESMHKCDFIETLWNEQAHIRNVRLALGNFWHYYQQLYVDLFLRGKVIPNSISKDDSGTSLLDILSDHGILERTIEFENRIQSNFLIYPLNNTFIITDFHNDLDIDRIFPIFHENVFLASKLKVPLGGKVLDIGFGSGIFSIVCALDGASEVYATDINLKTKGYAELNKGINNVDNRVHFLIGNGYEPLPRGIKFDLICSNPPFLPVPVSIPYYVHSNGGPRGTNVIETILRGLEEWIAPRGCFQMITMSLGNCREILICRMLRDIFLKHRASIIVKELSCPLPIDIFIENLNRKIPSQHSSEKIMNWILDTKAIGWTHLHYLYIEINFGRQFSFMIKKDDAESEQLRNRLDRQFGYLDGIQWKANNG